MATGVMKGLRGINRIICIFSFIVIILICYKLYEYHFIHGNLSFDYGDGSCAPRSNTEDYVELFQAWVYLANKLNITYFITKGSLLSVVRDGKLFPWDPDNDIDISMLHRDTALLEPYKTRRPVKLFKDKTIRVILQEEWRRYGGDRHILTCDNETSLVYSGLCGFRWVLARVIKGRSYIDIYEHNIQNNNVVDPLSRFQHKVEDIYPLQKCRFLNVTTLCPLKPTTILYKHYGKNLQPECKCKNKRWIKARWLWLF